MNQKLQDIFNIIQQSEKLDAEQKDNLLKALKDADKELEITAFKLERTEKVKKTTAILLEETIEELEQKRKAVEEQNRELEIESSLERVRAVAMSMNKSDDLISICEVSFKEFRKLGFDELRNAIIHIPNDEQKYFMDYDFSELTGGAISKIGYGSHPIVDEYLKKIKSAEDAYFEVIIHKDQLKEWKEFRKNSGQKDDPRLDDADALYYYLFSIGIGDIGISAFKPIDDSQIKILKRFRNVFDLAYRRYNDIALAEKQSRESQIELALERVRARTMAMQSSIELKEVVLNLFDGLKSLGVDPTVCNISLIDEKTSDSDVWSAHQTDTGLITYRVFISHFEHPFRKNLIDSFLNKTSFSVHELSGDSKKSYIQYLIDNVDYSNVPDEVTKSNKRLVNIEEGIVLSAAYMKYGLLIVSRKIAISNDESDILQRFAKIFEQTYTRFLDLKKAESQAREAQIEATLERVRAKAMAMHSSEDISDTMSVLFTELPKLGIGSLRCGVVLLSRDSSEGIFYAAATTEESDSQTVIGKGDMSVHPIFMKQREHWTRNENYFVTLRDEELKSYYAEIFRRSSTPYSPKEHETRTEHGYYFAFSEGMFYAWNEEPYPEESINILNRFRAIIDLTFRRYFDLKKAEAQAREAQIEIALERVRSRTMAMHKSEELKEVIQVLFNQFVQLKIFVQHTGFIIDYKNRDDMLIWLADQNEIVPNITIPYFDSPHWNSFINAKENGLDFFTNHLNFDEKNNFYQKLFSHIPDLPKESREYYFNCPGLAISTVLMNDVGLYIENFSGIPYTEEENRILMRFGKVFQQSYTRFLDLKKAEQRARESQIELSLERIRAQVTAMRESSELLDIVVTMRTEFVALGHEAHYFWYMRWLPDKYEKAMTSGDGTRIGMVMTLPRHIHGDVELVADWEKSNDATLVFAMDTDTAVEYVDKMISLGDFQQVDPQAPTLEDIRNLGGLTFIMARTTHGEIGFSLPGNVPDPPVESVTTLSRFAGVFDLAYKRYNDLAAAEAQAKEAIKQASLDRIRGEIASMRTSEDLNRITPIIWRELKTLNVPFIRCGVFIVDEANEKVQVYLTTPDGKPLGALNLSLDENDLTRNTVDYWKKKQVFREHWNKEEFINWTNSLIEIGQIQNAETYQGSSAPPESLDLHFVPFAQGMLYVGDISSLTDEKLNLVKTLAEAFSIAYARYEDFKNLEEAKNKIELTLHELKAAQAQLVHSEKMASLGELTAGIAHEIKNPLNFVNNFSEISAELISELEEELEKNDKQEVLEILKDLKQNLDKINQHGKRADSIVKGMLLHSRGTSGEKTPTDINDLLDQYVNLAYHGMRAQNKEFNITIEKDYDKSLEKINVVPQDISRVFLNIVNNACYAAYDKKVRTNSEFTPILSVTTKEINEKVEIRIKDNGNGIPESVRNSIFNPFFTTKPTGEGTGLGLSLSYDIVTKVHGGELKFETEPGNYTEFIITLPKLKGAT